MSVHAIGRQVGHVTQHSAAHFQVSRIGSAWIAWNQHACQQWSENTRTGAGGAGFCGSYLGPSWVAHTQHYWHWFCERTWWFPLMKCFLQNNKSTNHQTHNQSTIAGLIRNCWTGVFAHLSWLCRWIWVSLLPDKQQWPLKKKKSEDLFYFFWIVFLAEMLYCIFWNIPILM